MSREKNHNSRGRKERPEFDQKLLDLARVTRVVKGGRRFRFRATLVVGNKKGKVGVGVGKGSDVSEAIKKAFEDGKKHLITVSMKNTTISHDLRCKLGSAKVLLKPAMPGRGIIAGGAVRTVVEFSGIRDIVAKSLGTSNKLNVARATIEALSLLGQAKSRKERMEKKEL